MDVVFYCFNCINQNQNPDKEDVMDELNELNAIMLAALITFLAKDNKEVKDAAQDLLFNALNAAYQQGWDDHTKKG